MKNVVVLLALSLSAQYASAATTSFACEQLAGKTEISVSYNEGTKTLEITKKGVTKDFTITSETAGGAVDAVLSGESKQFGHVQMNLGSTTSMVYQPSSNEVDYVNCFDAN